MQAEFWRNRWVDNEIGWHQDAANGLLQKYWNQVTDGKSGTVLVPLCGKSLDMVWLAEQGHKVIGVELSEVAVEAFFRENQLEGIWEERAGFRVMQAGPYSIYCGDFFETSPEILGTIDFVYDRAAHIALPESVRSRYAKHLSELVSQRTRALLLTVEYDQSRRDGPPFSVPGREIEKNFSSKFQIETLSHNEIIDIKPKYKEWGLDSLMERASLLQVGES